MCDAPCIASPLSFGRQLHENLGLSPGRTDLFDLKFRLHDHLDDDQMTAYVDRELLLRTPQTPESAPSPIIRAMESPRVPMTPKSQIQGKAARLRRKIGITTTEPFDPVSSSLLRLYILHARHLPTPILTPDMQAHIDKLFMDWLNSADITANRTVQRVVETIVRLARARARMDLATTITKEHIDVCAAAHSDMSAGALTSVSMSSPALLI